MRLCGPRRVGLERHNRGDKTMGRPINKRFLGDFNDPGFQISATVNVNVGEGVEPGFILRQRSNSKYLVQGVNSGVQAVCRLVAALAPDLGEMSVAVLSDVKGLALLKDSQDETDYDGAGDNGDFVGGTGYANGDTITLSDGSVITVTSEDGGEVDGFTVTSVGDVFAAGSTLTETATSGGGSGFTLTPGVANRNPKPEFARIINNRTVKTFLGNVYSWPDDVNVVGRATSNIQGE